MMDNNKGRDIQNRLENLLRDNASTSYSKEEIINLLSYEGVGTQEELEKILGEIEVWSSMKDSKSSIYSACKGGTVYFQWESAP
jgi:arginine repressor